MGGFIRVVLEPGVGAIHNVAPEVPGLGVSPCGVFPFRFRRQTAGTAGLLYKLLDVLIIDLLDRVIGFIVFRRIETHDFFPTSLGHFVSVHIKIVKAHFVLIFLIGLGIVVAHREASALDEYHAFGSLFGFELVLLRQFERNDGRGRPFIDVLSLYLRDGRRLVLFFCVIALGATHGQGQQY